MSEKFNKLWKLSVSWECSPRELFYHKDNKSCCYKIAVFFCLILFYTEVFVLGYVVIKFVIYEKQWDIIRQDFWITFVLYSDEPKKPI